MIVATSICTLPSPSAIALTVPSGPGRLTPQLGDGTTESDEVAEGGDLVEVESEARRFLDEVDLELVPQPQHERNEGEGIQTDLVPQRKLRTQRAIRRGMHRILQNEVRDRGFDFDVIQTILTSPRDIEGGASRNLHDV